MERGRAAAERRRGSRTQTENEERGARRRCKKKPCSMTEEKRIAAGIWTKSGEEIE